MSVADPPPPSAASEPVPRPAARAVILDAAERVLLVRFESEDGSRTWWATPGGGLEPDETYEQAVLRELAEETGLEGAELGPVVWTREQVFQWGGRHFRQQERFFVIRVEAHELAPEFDALNRNEGIHECRWWTLDELEHTAVEFTPRHFPRLLRSLLEDGVPPTPVDTGI